MNIHQTSDVAIVYDDGLVLPAKEVSELYPSIKHDLEALFGWKLGLKPTIFLVKKRESFLRMTGSKITVAFAIPERKLIVIDYSKMVSRPFSLETTLRHELCHILLHTHIRRNRLPKWLDEGLCQWASGGIDEIIMNQKRSLLNKASMSRRFIRLNALSNKFPVVDNSRILAYEESKSFVTFLMNQFGKQKVLQVLALLRDGNNPKAAIQTIFGISLEDLEKRWHNSLEKEISLLTHISHHLYEILFAGAALITIYAFIRMKIRKRNYPDEDVEDGKGSESFF